MAGAHGGNRVHASRGRLEQPHAVAEQRHLGLDGHNGLTSGMSYCVRVTPFRDTASTGGFGTVDVSGDPTYLDPNNDGTSPGIHVHQPADRGCLHALLHQRLPGRGRLQRPDDRQHLLPGAAVHLEAHCGRQRYFVIVARDPAFSTIVDYAFTHLPVYAPRSGSSPRTYQNQSTHYYWVVLPATGANGSGAVNNPTPAMPSRSTVRRSGRR